MAEAPQTVDGFRLSDCASTDATPRNRYNRTAVCRDKQRGGRTEGRIDAVGEIEYMWFAPHVVCVSARRDRYGMVLSTLQLEVGSSGRGSGCLERCAMTSRWWTLASPHRRTSSTAGLYHLAPVDC